MKATLDVQMVPNLKTALVWGTLPGATDETIYVVAHRDGWFDAAGDNAVGVADLSLLADAFNSTPSDAVWNARADLNADNTVDIEDLSLLADGFFQNGDP